MLIYAFHFIKFPVKWLISEVEEKMLSVSDGPTDGHNENHGFLTTRKLTWTIVDIRKNQWQPGNDIFNVKILHPPPLEKFINPPLTWTPCMEERNGSRTVGEGG